LRRAAGVRVVIKTGWNAGDTIVIKIRMGCG